MEHFAPHPSSKFEGYYSKFTLPSGASLALVVCTVPKARKKPHMVSFTYVPRVTEPSTHSENVYQKELWVKDIQRISTGAGNAFELRIPSLGSVKCAADSTTVYDLEHDDFSFYAVTTTRTPWSQRSKTPEGMLVKLPLPLHWYVHSLQSDCDFTLCLPAHQANADVEGKATVHQEKNWAQSFPNAHIWIQARDDDRGFCCAGGQILGMEAFLLGYRSPQHNLDFRPPFALRILGLSPFLSYNVDWKNRTFALTVQSFTQKMVVCANASKGTFFSLSSPFAEGHRENFLAQSYEAELSIRLYMRSWFGSWTEIHKDHFEGAALEFGGAYYPMAGTEKKLN